MITMLPVGPTIPTWLSPLLSSMQDAITELQTPGSPVALWSTPSSDLPPASDWTDCAAIASDLKTIVYSNGTAWVRVDTGATL